MKRVLAAWLFVSAMLIVHTASAQNRNYQEGPVWRQFSYRIKPGQESAFWNDFRENGKPIFEMAKKEGVLVDYRLYLNPFKAAPGDWDVMLVMVLPNYAMLDQLEARIVAIYNRHYGSPEATAAAVKKRNEYREIIGDRIIREVTLK